jgi:polyisoprenoid-binding protein YceI
MKIPGLLFVLLFYCESAWANSSWLLLQEKSTLTFIATYDGVEFEGQFSEYSVSLSFDTNDLSNSQVESTVNVSSMNTQSRDRDQALSEPDWFYFKKFPQAGFTSHTFSQIDADEFTATGIMHIRDQQHEVTIPFSWRRIDDQHARLESEFMLDRRTYDIGTGSWKDDETIGFSVTVKMNLYFTRGLN